MKPIEIACRHVDYDSNGDEVNCAAQQGEKCNWLSLFDVDMDDHGSLFHAERIEDAAAMGDIDAD